VKQSAIDRKVEFIMEIGKALHVNGVSAQNLEEALVKLSNKLDLQGQFFATPTVIIASFDTAEGKKNSMTRVSPGIIDLQKLMRIDRIGDSVLADKLSPEEALKHLHDLSQSKRLYPAILEVLAYAIVAGAAAIFFKGGFKEFYLSIACGVIVGIINELTFDNALSKSFEFIAALFVALATALLFSYSGDFSIQLVTIASLIVLIPGLTLTISMTELATNNLAAGTARLMQAILTFFKLGFGVAIGTSIVASSVHGLKFFEKSHSPFLLDFTWPALIAAAFAFTILFRAKLLQYPWVLAAGIVAFFTTQSASMIYGSDLGAFIGGLAVGLFANFYARFRKHPAALISMPGLILLVPGSIGFRGIASLVHKDTLAGISATFDMFMIAIALVSGLLLANIFLPPKRSL
jgi:uncharacterized membrane protein YjjP (DUF1212 family)